MIQYSLRNELFGNLNKGDKETDKKDEMMIVSQESLVKKIYIILSCQDICYTLRNISIQLHLGF